ncbi:coproporphyrinogen III oxidase [Pseudomonas aeruginosa]
MSRSIRKKPRVPGVPQRAFLLRQKRRRPVVVRRRLRSDPYYAHEEDCVHWHPGPVSDACRRSAADVYRAWEWCDTSPPHLKHRNEPRGIGDAVLRRPHSTSGTSAFAAAVVTIGDTYIDAYLPIVQRLRTRVSMNSSEIPGYRRGPMWVSTWSSMLAPCSAAVRRRRRSILMSLPPRCSRAMTGSRAGRRGSA